MIKKQLEILTSQYAALYDLIIPKDHMLRRINEEIDFSMIEDELINANFPNFTHSMPSDL